MEKYEDTPPGTAPSVSLGTDPSFSRPTTTTTQESGSKQSGSKPATTSATSSSGLGLTGVSAPSTANTSSSSASNRQPGGYRVLDDGRILSYSIRYYRDGSVYEGEFLGNKRHGTGTLLENGVGKYEGEFKDNLYDGFGVYLWFPPVFSEVERLRKKEMPSEKRYEGQWVAGKKDGFGHFKMEDGSQYEGNFRKNRFHGFGKLTTKTGDSYEGEWVRNKLEGQGKITYASGDVYTGEMMDGRFDGDGYFEYRPVRLGPKGVVKAYYRGEFYRGYRHGKGTRVFSDGSKYDGRWVHGEMQGHGLMVFNNGNQYIGEWEHGLPHGQGVLLLKHGDKYEGAFHRGVPYGRGRYTYADGGVYDGEYLATKGGYEHGVRFPQPDGLKCGHGKRTWVSSNTYKGMWHDNRMEGEGLLTKGAGGSYQGEWYEDKRQGRGKESWGNRLGNDYTCPLGHAHPGKGYCNYEGGFERDLMHGKGRLVCMDGRSYEGLWRHGQRHGYGMQVLVPSQHRGDAKRQFIGGVGSLYRPVKYEGQWVDGQRTGRGYVEYANGLQVHGQFEAGRLTGVCTTVYPATTAYGRPAPMEQRKKRLGMYERGNRVMWISPSFTDAEQTIEDPNPPLEPPPELRPDSQSKSVTTDEGERLDQ